jgi:hypothetical protein
MPPIHPVIPMPQMSPPSGLKARHVTAQSEGLGSFTTKPLKPCQGVTPHHSGERLRQPYLAESSRQTTNPDLATESSKSYPISSRRAT